MDKKWTIVLISAALVSLAIACVTATSSACRTPLYTVRMEQQSSKLNFLPTEVSQFAYTAQKGYNVDYHVAACCYAAPLSTSPASTCNPSCFDTCEDTCEDTCFETCEYTCSTCTDPTCPATCPATCSTCNPTCDEPTCASTCPSTCAYTCAYSTCAYSTCFYSTCYMSTCQYSTCNIGTCGYTCPITCWAGC
jgi:modification target Cys-rich repeat protein